MGNWKETYRRFRTWQQQPHQVKPLSEASHVCTTCDTRFEGNYCPRCGQSARIGRYSFKKAFLLFPDFAGDYIVPGGDITAEATKVVVKNVHNLAAEGDRDRKSVV